MAKGHAVSIDWKETRNGYRRLAAERHGVPPAEQGRRVATVKARVIQVNGYLLEKAAVTWPLAKPGNGHALSATRGGRKGKPSARAKPY